MNELVLNRTPEIVAAEIRSFTASMLGNIIEIGRRMCEAKEMIPYGQFGDWIRSNTGYSSSTANNFMRIYQEYGAAQGCMFGAEAESQTLGKLSYTKALALLALPAGEREEFVEANNVEQMSSRELQAAIRERDELKKQLEEERRGGEGAALQLSEANSRASAFAEKAASLRDANAQLSEELKALKNRPVDVAVQEPDPEEIDRRASELAKTLLADADERYKAETDKLRAKIEAVEKKRDKLEQAVKDAEARGAADAAPIRAELDAAKAEAAKAQNEADALRRELAMADADTTAFKLHFEELQRSWNLALGILNRADGDKADKLKNALRSLSESFARTVAI